MPIFHKNELEEYEKIIPHVKMDTGWKDKVKVFVKDETDTWKKVYDAIEELKKG